MIAHGYQTPWDDEFNAPPIPVPQTDGTWTIAILSSLKSAGKALRVGWVRRILRAALPLGHDLVIILNDGVLEPSKVDASISADWSLGQGIDLPDIELPGGDVWEVTTLPSSIALSHIGTVTGRVVLYKNSISGGKSDDVVHSNGFFINVLGRVINLDDPYFGLENLSHSAWSRFRATIRADGLDAYLAVNRESLLHYEYVDGFRRFLLSLFNKARTAHDSASRANWPDVGAMITNAWHNVPLGPLSRTVATHAATPLLLPDIIDISNVDDYTSLSQRWKSITPDDHGDLIQDIVFEPRPPEAPLARYDLGAQKIVINQNHPFVIEHGQSADQKALLRDAILVDILTEFYMLDTGIHDHIRREVAMYRDQLLRLVARVSRRNAVQVAQLLVDVATHPKAFEQIVGDALEHLGFIVTRLGQSGEPEGIAAAPLPPRPTMDPYVHETRAYKFTYDAKSTNKTRVQTKDVNISGLARHRRKHGADYTLVVAPDFADGTALPDECAAHRVTPLRADDLARLLIALATTGPVDVDEFASLFEVTSPDDAGEWVRAYIQRSSLLSRISLSDLLAAFDSIGFQGPNAIHVSVIADRLGQLAGENAPPEYDVRRIVDGISVTIPSLVRTTQDGKVFLSTSPAKLRQALVSQLQTIPEEYRVQGVELPIHSTSYNANQDERAAR